MLLVLLVHIATRAPANAANVRLELTTVVKAQLPQTPVFLVLQALGVTCWVQNLLISVTSVHPVLTTQLRVLKALIPVQNARMDRRVQRVLQQCRFVQLFVPLVSGLPPGLCLAQAAQLGRLLH